MANYITLKEYAEAIGVPFRTVQTRARQKQIPTIKVGNSVMIEKSTPWEARRVGRLTNEEQEAKSVSSKQKHKVVVQKVYYVAVVDNSGKEITSDFTFLTKADAEAIGKRMKQEVEGRL
jgi:hypothetical protein